ncbi:alpha-ribazole phosphatase [uncultured Acetobacteroides sp.]|uniref:alpha-ribazole phosphatase n=1 Tax=uncultured Acetobacteroides sp. TaxID=1760811 RepID=UPI0029F504F6|nr:alpha-ribazole phosphatase [uncultured Acetobacteroides sp.]
MIHLYLVRHTSVAAPAGTCYGQTDVALAVTFSAEAEVVRNTIKGIPFDAVYSSPLSRCTKLAERCGFADCPTDARLMEMHFGDWENRRWSDIGDPHLQRWFDAWATERATNGESFADVCHRASDFINSQSWDGEDVRMLLFTHAGFIRALWVALGMRSPEEAFAQQVNYGAVVKVVLDERSSPANSLED